MAFRHPRLTENKKTSQVRYNLTRFADSRCRGIQSFKGRALIFFLVKEKIFLRRIIRPNILYAFVYFTVIFEFLKILDHVLRGARTVCVIDQFIFCCWPWSIVQAAG